MSYSQVNARDAFATLCGLYGDHNAQALMGVRGACVPRVARLARAFGKCEAAVKAAVEYRRLASLGRGYLRLMTAAKGDGTVKRLIAEAGEGRNFSAWEIDTAVNVLLAVYDAQRRQ